MEFIAFIVAIIAFGLAIRSRSRIALLEHHLELISKRLEGGAATARAAPPAAAPSPRSPLEDFAPKPAAEAPPAAPPPPRMDEREIEKIISDAAQSPAPPTAPETPAEPPKSFEERFGASWVVWIGGIALALGGIFMVQYSIEAGLIGPGDE